MTAPSSTLDAVAEPTAVEPPFDPAVVEEVVRQLARAVRTHQLYLPNNPVYQRVTEVLHGAFAALWAHTDEVVLDITESEFRWEGLVVGQEASKSESLPWLFYKDGIRQLTLRRGFEGDELNLLLDVLRRIRLSSPELEDLLTLLWEQDFVHLRYRYVDLALATAPAIEGGRPHEREALDVRSEESSEETRSELVRPETLDATLYFLDEQDIEYLRSEIKDEYRRDPRRNVLAILFDLLELQMEPRVRAEILENLESMMLHMLAARELSIVALMLREARDVAERAPELVPEQRARLLDLGQRLSSPEVLTQMLQALDDASVAPAQEDLDALFAQLSPATLATLLSWLDEARNARLREALERAAGRLAAAHTGELIKLIGADDSRVAEHAMRRAAELKTAAAVGPLGKLLGSPDTSRRLAAVRALAEIASPGALQLLDSALEDGDRDVRVAAVRAVAARSYHAARARVDAIVRAKAVRAADLTEKMAFFEAYGVLAGAGGVGYLDGLLNARGLFARREDAEIRACAAMALGRIGSDEALTALRRATDDRDVLVRNAVNRALRGGDS